MICLCDFSLADIYEGALRKVLNLQLNLKIEEHPRFHDLNHDVTYRDKSSPPRPRAIRIEDVKQREEYRHQRRANEDENDPRITPQGHNVLRKVGERSPAEGSAFHVPSKRRYDGHSFNSMERESDVPVDRFGVPRHVGPDYPGEYGQSHYHPQLYGPRMDQMGGPRLGPSFMDPRSVVRETYSRYSRHHREIPPLFPVHCSTSERDGPTTARSTEHERRERRCPDVPRLNGLHDRKYTNLKMPFAKFEQEEKENLEETFNKASKSLSIHASNSPLSPDRTSPRTDRVQPYGRHTRPNSNPTTNGCEDKNNEKPHKEMDKDKKQLTGEEGEKEEFLSNLGLARIF